MNDKLEAYVTGKQEGYFNVRLDYSILDEDQQCRAFFMTGYQSGKAQRLKESKSEQPVDKKKFEKARKAYITVMGYKASFENYTVDSALLKGDDQEAFDSGYQIGLLCKLGKIFEIKGEDLETYMMIAGYEINEESFRVYLDMLKARKASMFHTGYEVRKKCEDIRKSSIAELNNKHSELMINNIKKMS